MSMKFIILVHLYIKMPTIVGIQLTFIRKINTNYEKFKARKVLFFQHFSVLWAAESLCSVELTMKIVV